MNETSPPAPPAAAEAIAWWAEMVGVQIAHERLPDVTAYLNEIGVAVAALEHLASIDLDVFAPFDPHWAGAER